MANGQTRNLTTKLGWPELLQDAVFSPNEERIAYAWHNEQDFDDLRVINTDGSGLQTLFRDQAVRSVSVKDWSPDAQEILAVLLRYDSTVQTVLVPVSGGAPRILAARPGPAHVLPGRMVFSPDGRYIAYDVAADATAASHDIFVLPTAGGKAAALVRHPADDRLIGWSPDGNAIAFASNRNGTVDIWLLSVQEGRVPGTPVLIRRDIGQMKPLALARDGSFYFAVSSCDCELHVARLHPLTGKLQGEPEPMGHALERSGADWSPDGRYLAYLAPTGGVLPAGFRTLGSWAVAIRSVETGEQRVWPVPLKIVHQLRPLWSPDGRAVLVFGWDAYAYPREVAYALDPQTGNLRTLFSSESLWKRMFEWPAWAAAGTAIFHTEQPAEPTTGVVMRDLSSRTERDLFRHETSHYESGLTAAPDGQHLAYTIWRRKDNTSSLAVWSLARNEQRKLLEVAEPAHIWPPVWQPDSRHLMYFQNGQLWRIAIDGGEPESLGSDARFNLNWAGLGLHPAGDRIAFVAVKERRSEVRVIRGLMPSR